MNVIEIFYGDGIRQERGGEVDVYPSSRKRASPYIDHILTEKNYKTT